MEITVKTKLGNLPSILYRNPGHFGGMYLKSEPHGLYMFNLAGNNKVVGSFMPVENTNYGAKDDGQLDFQEHTSPLILWKLLSHHFMNCMTDHNLSWLNTTTYKLDVEDSIEIEVSSIQIDNTWHNVIPRYMPIIFTPLKGASKVYRMVYRAKTTVGNAIADIMLVASMLSVVNTNNFFTDKGYLTKLTKLIEFKGSVPYFILYLLKMRVYAGQFHNFKDKLESITGYTLTEGDTHTNRMKWVYDNLGNHNIVDYGCGSMRHGRYLAKRHIIPNGLVYTGIDKEHYSSEAEYLNRRYSTDNFQFMSSISNYLYLENNDIIISEVLEHNPLNIVPDLVNTIINSVGSWHNVLITLPNKLFNTYYELDEDESRHDDHKWEWTPEIGDKLKKDLFDRGYVLQGPFQIGDIVEGQSYTIGYKITNNG